MLARRLRDELLHPVAEGSPRVDGELVVTGAYSGADRGGEREAGTGVFAALVQHLHRTAEDGREVEPEDRGRHHAEVRERAVAPADVGVGVEHGAEAVGARGPVERGARVGHRRELIRPGDQGAEVLEVRSRLDRPSGLRREAEESAVERDALGDARDGCGVAAVEDGERRSGSWLRLSRVERRREQLREQARPTHSAPHDVVEIVAFEVAHEGEKRVDLALHPLRLVEPTEPVGDLVRVVLPERVIVCIRGA